MSSLRSPQHTASLEREVRRLALPAIAHSLLQTLVFVVDRVMLGQHSAHALAGIQIAGAVEWCVWSVFAACCVGAVARVGHHVGAGKPAEARSVAWLSLSVALVAGVVVAISAPLVVQASTAIARGASRSVLDESSAYLTVILPASPVVFVALAAVAVLQAGGDTRTPLAIGVGANVVHIALNRVFILGALGVPALGARGAAISTALTFALEAAALLGALSRQSGAVSIRGPVDRASVRAEWGPFASVALPAVFERVVYQAGFLGFVAMIAQLGDAAMAANQALISIESISFLSADGFGVAAAAMVAQKLGAGEGAMARRAALIATRDAVVTLSLFGALAWLGRASILPWFSRDGEVIALASRSIAVLLVAQPFMAVGAVVAHALRGAGRTREVFAVSLAGALFVRLAATYLFAVHLKLGLVGVWLGSTADWVVRSVLLLVGVRRQR